MREREGLIADDMIEEGGNKEEIPVTFRGDIDVVGKTF